MKRTVQFAAGGLVIASIALLVWALTVAKERKRLEEYERYLDARNNGTAGLLTIIEGKTKEIEERERIVAETKKNLDRRESEVSARADRLTEWSDRLTRENRAVESKQQEVFRREATIKRRDDLLIHVYESQERVKKAIHEREAQFVDVKHLDEVVKSVDAKIEKAQSTRATSAWEIRAKEQSIKELIEAREARALRSSADSYSSEAAVIWELETLQELAGKLKLAGTVVPKNEFKLLDWATLDNLESRWTAKYDELRKRNAATSGLFDQTLEFTSLRLAAIREAKSVPQVNLQVAFTLHAMKAEVDRDVISWLSTKNAFRDVEIRQREAVLLAAALARDRWNLPAFVRTLQLEATQMAGELPKAVLRRRQMLVLSRAEGFSPIPNTSGAISELLKDRFADPLSAVRSESRLFLQWQESGRGLQFEAWMVRQLSNAQIFELKGFLESARERVALITVDIPTGLEEHVKVDRDQIEAEFRALENEIKQREAGKGGPEDLSKEPVESLRRQLQSTEDSQFRGIHWNRLRVYLARIGSNSEAERLAAALAVQGFEELLGQLESQKGKLDDWRKECTRYGKTAEDVTEFRDSKSALAEGRAMIESGLRSLVDKVSDVAKLKQLQERIKMNFEGIPPPEGFELIADPYDDIRLRTRLTTVSNRLQSMLSKVTQWEADLKLEVQRKEEEAKRELHMKEARRVAQIFLKEYPDLIPADFEQSENTKIEFWAEELAKVYSLDKLRRMGKSKTGFATGSYQRNLEQQYSGSTVLFLGIDALGREKYSINGDVRVINRHSDGKVTICPADVFPH